jgi:NAD(P)-dependent dehydrogenase (short-subunit alcohol dehydrogenase family)
MRRVCLLTGAAGALGTAFCRRYAETYEIAAVYRTRAPSVSSQLQMFVDPLEPQAILPENQHPVFAIRADLTVDADIERIVELTLARFDRIDVVVYAAVHSVWAPIVDSDKLLSSVQRQFAVNVMAPLRLAACVARAYWRDRRHENTERNRNVVNVSSVAGVRVFPGAGQSVYSASKAALNFLSRHMADEFAAFGVRVNALAPNSFPRRVATKKVAEAVHHLDCGTMTGRVMVVDKSGERLD